MANLFVKSGDLTRTILVDAIVTGVNSGGVWFGGVDQAIQNIAGSHYHEQLAQVLQANGLYDGQAIVTRGDKTRHDGNFDDVIFVIDDLDQPLNQLVYAALKAAKKEHYKSVGLPLMRTGLMAGMVEATLGAVIEQMKLGINRFLAEGDVEMNIFIVVYDNQPAVKMLAGTMTLIDK